MLDTLDTRPKRLWRAATHASALPTLTVLAERKFRRLVRKQSKALVAPEIALADQTICVSTTDNKIPRILFQTWKSRTALPSNYALWRSTFLSHNPEYQCLIWDDADNRAFVAKHFSWFLSTYDAFPKEIFRVDAVRLLFLFHHGGFYCDLDTECLKSLDTLRDNGDVLLGRMGEDPGFAHAVPNAAMASRPRQLFWLLAIALMITAIEQAGTPDALLQLGPEAVTGPVLVREAALFYLRNPPAVVMQRAQQILAKMDGVTSDAVEAGTLKLLDSEIWYPLDWTNPLHRLLRADIMEHRATLTHEQVRRLFPHSHLVTYWSHSWVESYK